LQLQFLHLPIPYILEKNESGRERIPRSLLRGKRANGEHNYSLWIEDSPQFTAESFSTSVKEIILWLME
jgi:hypothetical protein